MPIQALTVFIIVSSGFELVTANISLSTESGWSIARYWAIIPP